MSDDVTDRTGSGPSPQGSASFSPPQRLGQRLRLPLMVGVPVLVAGVAIYAYLTGGRYQSTDDAYVQSAKVQISANVSGRITAINVHENQSVTQGAPLLTLDAAPFEAAVAQAEAQAAQSRIQVATLRAAHAQRQAETRAADQGVAFQKREFDRQKTLLAAGVTSQSAVDQAQNGFDAAVQKLAAAKDAEAAALAALGGAVDTPTDKHPLVRAADAMVQSQRLNAAYTHLTAPQDGIVTRVDQVQVGAYVNAAQPLFDLVSPRVWIEANFKEDQLAHVRVGQSATVQIDARKGVAYHGKVASLSPGTGSSFALLPPENATGNWVKVVQRLPIRIELDPREVAKAPLAAGLSAHVQIDTEFKQKLFGGDAPAS